MRPCRPTRTWLAAPGLTVRDAARAIGLLAMSALSRGWDRAGALLLGVYGLLGTDGLLHYTLALCSEHTLPTNVTIWAEVVLGVVLACTAAVTFCGLQAARWSGSAGVPVASAHAG